MESKFEIVRAEPEELWDQPDTFKKKVALYGFGYTRELIYDHPLVDENCEIWSGGHIWKQETAGVVPPLDRVFELHKDEHLANYPSPQDREHYEWLQQEHHYPIYMQELDPKFPSAVQYPYEEINDEIFSKTYRGRKPKYAYGSSIDFMAALALYEGYDWIGYFGIEMSSETEFIYQLPDAQFHLGFAGGRGVTTWVPDDPRCKLLGRVIYGYEGFQMISRQTLGKAYQQFEQQRRDALSNANTFVGAYRLFTGQLGELKKNGGISEEQEQEAIKLGMQVRNSRELAAIISGCMIATKWFIQVADGEEPDMTIYETMFDDIPMHEQEA